MGWIWILGLLFVVRGLSLANESGLSISMVGPEGPVHLSQRVTITWVVTTNDTLLPNDVECRTSKTIVTTHYLSLGEWTQDDDGNYKTNGSIVLASVKEEDGGPYNCTHIFESGGTVSASYYLDINGNPKDDQAFKHKLVIGVVLCLIIVALVVIIFVFYSRRKRTMEINEN